MSEKMVLVAEIDALYAKATQVEWRALRTRVDGADGYLILHGDLHGKTQGENLANLQLAAALVNRWPEIRALLAAPCSDELLKNDARYRWWRENIELVSRDEAGITGVAYSFQVPLDDIHVQSDAELMDMIADAAIASEREGK